MTADRPDLSIVIPVHNAAETLRQQLQAVVSSIDADMEVVVVDNGSTDASRAIAEDFAMLHPQVRVVEAADRSGEPFARNAGWAAARARAIAFCDADDVVAPTWARAMRTALQSADYVTGPVELDRLNPPWLAGARGRTVYAELPRTIRSIPFAHGCNIGIRREVIEGLGGFVDTGGAGTDADLGVRAWQAGIPLGWDERAAIHYRHRTGTRERWRQAIAYGVAADHLHRVVGEPWGPMVRVRHQMHRARWLLATAPLLLRRDHRARWLWTMGVVVGEIRGAGR